MIVHINDDDTQRVVSTVTVMARDKLVKQAEQLKKQIDKDLDSFFRQRRETARKQLHAGIDKILVHTGIDVEASFRPADRTYKIEVSAKLPKSPVKLAVSNPDTPNDTGAA